MDLLLVVLGAAWAPGAATFLAPGCTCPRGTASPRGTFAVNALGSLMIGLVFGLAQSKAISPDTTLFLTVGLLAVYLGFAATRLV